MDVDAIQRKNTFLDRDETWNRAKNFFPGLLPPRDYSGRYRTIPMIQRALHEELGYKLSKLKREDAVRFQQLMTPDGAPELCVALGMNETVVHKRFELVRNFEAELGITGKLHILDSIKHLVQTININNNPFADDLEEHVTGRIVKAYRNEDWLSYLGMSVNRGGVADAIKDIRNELDREKLSNCYLLGTAARDLTKTATMEER